MAKERRGRPITGWKRGIRIKSAEDVCPGDVLIMDSDRFDATNLIRVKAHRALDGESISGFYYRYVSPDLEIETSGGSADTMLAWYWEIEREAFFKVEPEEGNEIGARYMADRKAFQEHNRMCEEMT